MSERSGACVVVYGCRSMHTSFGPEHRFLAGGTWFFTNSCQAVNVAVEPWRPAPIQLSMSLTRTQPANRRLPKVLVASVSGNEQFVPPPPYCGKARRQAQDRILRIDLGAVRLVVERNDDAVRIAAQDGRREQGRHVHAANLARGAAATMSRDRRLHRSRNVETNDHRTRQLRHVAAGDLRRLRTARP